MKEEAKKKQSRDAKRKKNSAKNHKSDGDAHPKTKRRFNGVDLIIALAAFGAVFSYLDQQAKWNQQPAIVAAVGTSIVVLVYWKKLATIGVIALAGYLAIQIYIKEPITKPSTPSRTEKIHSQQVNPTPGVSVATVPTKPTTELNKLLEDAKVQFWSNPGMAALQGLGYYLIYSFVTGFVCLLASHANSFAQKFERVWIVWIVMKAIYWYLLFTVTAAAGVCIALLLYTIGAAVYGLGSGISWLALQAGLLIGGA